MERTTTLGSRRTRLLRRLELIDIPGCWDRMDALGRAREQTRAKPAYASAVTVTGSPLGGAPSSRARGGAAPDPPPGAPLA